MRREGKERYYNKKLKINFVLQNGEKKRISQKYKSSVIYRVFGLPSIGLKTENEISKLSMPLPDTLLTTPCVMEPSIVGRKATTLPQNLSKCSVIWEGKKEKCLRTDCEAQNELLDKAVGCSQIYMLVLSMHVGCYKKIN